MLENGSYNEDEVDPITNCSIRLVLECSGRILQYPMSSWHFLLIVMTTDSVIFHWIWTGIHVDNQLWVIRDPLFYLRPVLSLLWLHLSLWLLLLPAHDHLCYQPLMAVHSGEWYPLSVSVIPHIWASFGLLIITVILLMLHSTPFALWTSPQWNRICEWSVIVLSTTNKRIIFFVINLSKKYYL